MYLGIQSSAADMTAALRQDAVLWLDAANHEDFASEAENLGWGGSVLNAKLGSVGPASTQNKLTALQADIESAIGSYTAAIDGDTGFYNGGAANPALALDTAEHTNGASCLKLTSSAAATVSIYMYGALSWGTMPVNGSNNYTFTMDVKAPAISTGFTMRIYWWTSGGAAASTASTTTTLVSLSSAWQTFTGVVAAPADAAFCSFRIYWAAAGAGEVVYIDKLGFWKGSGGDWRLPGIDIPGASVDINDPRWLDYHSPHDGYVYAAGVAGNYISIYQGRTGTQSVEYAARISVQTIGITNSIAGGGSTWEQFFINSSNKIVVAVLNSPGFVSIGGAASSVALPIVANQPIWIKGKVTIATAICEYQYSTSNTNSLDEVEWVPLGVPVTGANAGTTPSLPSSLIFGSTTTGGAGFVGKIHAGAYWYNDVLQRSFDCSILTSRSATTLASNEGDLMTIARSAGYPRLNIDYADGAYVYLPGVAGNFISAPDEAALDIVGDLDLIVKAGLDNWLSPVNQGLIGKDDNLTQRSYGLYISNSGKLTFIRSPDGTIANTVTKDSTVATGIAPGATKWVRTTYQANSSGSNIVTFYLSDDGFNWTGLGSPVVTAGSAALFSGTGTLYTGRIGSGTSLSTGKFYRAIVKSGLNGTVVMDQDFGLVSGSTSTITALTGQTVTITKAAGGRKPVCAVQPCFLFGTDDYMQILDNALLDFNATDSFTVVAVVRQLATQTASGRWMDKRGGTGAGWIMAPFGGAQQIYPFIQGVGGATGGTGVAFPIGTMFTGVLRIDRSTESLVTVCNNVFGASTTTATTGTIENAKNLLIGRDSDGSQYQDFELMAVAVFRRALSQREIEEITQHFLTRKF